MWRKSLVALATGLFCYVGCEGATNGGGTQTNWLTCRTNEDCKPLGSGFTCEEGRCTNGSIDRDAQVGGRDAATFGETMSDGATDDAAYSVPCDPNCPGTCIRSGCLVELASGQDFFDIDANASHVFWMDSNGAIMMMPLAGGSIVPLAIARSGYPGMGVDATTLFFVDPNNTLSKLSLDADGASPIAIAANQDVADIMIDETSVYWATRAGSLDGSMAGATLMKASLTGGVQITLASGVARQIALDATSLYWIDLFDLGVKKVPKEGGSVTTLTQDAQTWVCIAVRGENVFLGDGEESGGIYRMPVTGGPYTRLGGDVGIIYTPFVVDDDNVYWTTMTSKGGLGTRAVVKMPVTGGPATILAEDEAVYIAVDATSVYWTTATGSLFKLTPK